MLSRRTFICLLSAALCGAAGRGTALASMPAERLPAGEIGGIIRTKSLFATSGMDLEPLREAVRSMGAAGLRRYLKELDTYASYTTAEELAIMQRLTKDLPAGVGMDIFEDRQQRMRCAPYPGSPAERAGIRYADVLRGVDGQAVRGASLREVAQLIRGETGSMVRLSVHSGHEAVRTVTMERAPGEYPTAARTRISPAVIRIYRFARQTPDELKTCLQNLADDEGCIIDLRGNTGGNMQAGMECARLFLKKGVTVLRLKDRLNTRETIASKNGKWSDLPLTIMQDQFTASAAELFIASLTAAGRARTHGTQSAGKACVQNIFPLSDGSVRKLTTEKMLYPGSDDDWEGTGIAPSRDCSVQ